jgi:hypothetical protein
MGCSLRDAAHHLSVGFQLLQVLIGVGKVNGRKGQEDYSAPPTTHCMFEFSPEKWHDGGSLHSSREDLYTPGPSAVLIQ